MKRNNRPTELLFRKAGISEGMSVLELGSGPGEVTEVLAGIVGRTGRVVAVDRSEKMLAMAKERLQGAGVENVRFVCADLNGTADYLKDVELASFDVVAGRRVLMYLAKPEAVIEGLLPWIRPGGLVVFEEMDSTMCPGLVGSMPGHEQALVWLGQMLDGEGAQRAMGLLLPAVFAKAGLHFERIWAEAVIEGQGDQFPLGQMLGLLTPRLESTGIATAPEIEALIAQINAERDPSRVFVSAMRFCALGTKPQDA